MSRRKQVLTTGEIAKICNVAPRTVSKWFDSGQLRGYRIPGSRDRRVPVDQLVRFMKTHQMPLNGLDAGTMKVLVVDDDGDLLELLTSALGGDAGYEVCSADNVLDAGICWSAQRPSVVLIDVDLPGLSIKHLFRAVRNHPDLADCRVIAMTGPIRESDRQALKEAGFAAMLSKPFDTTAIIRTIEDVTAQG